MPGAEPDPPDPPAAPPDPPPDEPSASAGPLSVLDALAARHGRAPRVRLAEGADDDAGAAAPAPAAAALAAGRGRRVEVLDEIARGGMGVVLRGRDVDLGRDVAIKVLHPELAERDDVVERFVEEAQIGGQLQHPGIVPIYELGLMADERPYFAMKLVKGRTLAELLAERDAADPRQRHLDVFLAVCQTVAYAHARRVIHRDLKPANVMVGAFGEVQVVDWGLAKVLGRDEPEPAREAPAADVSRIETVRSGGSSVGGDSLVGSVLGTPAYMPPEQALGRIDRLDERADVFALGSILCELLTGSPAYAGPPDQVLVQAAEADLDDALARLGRCGADEALVALARACLAPAPDARPADAGIVAERVRTHLASVEERAQAARVEAAEAQVRAEGERRSRRLTFALAATVLVGLVAAWGVRRELETRRLARADALAARVEAALEEAERQRDEGDRPAALTTAERAVALASQPDGTEELAARAARLRDRVAAELAAVAAAREREARRAELLARLDDVRAIERRLGGEISGAAAGGGGGELEPLPWSDEEGWARRLAERRDAGYRAAFAELGVDVGHGAPEAAAAALEELGGAELAPYLDAWAVDRLRAGGAEDALARRLLALAARLDPHPVRDRLRGAIRDDDPEAVALVAAGEGVLAPASAALVWHALADVRRDLVAAALERTALAHPDDAGTRVRLAALLGERREEEDLTRMLAHASAARALRPQSSATLDKLGFALQALGFLDEAEALYRRAHEAEPDHPLWINNLGVAAHRRGHVEEALERYRRAHALDPDAELYLRNLRRTLRAAGRAEELRGVLEAWLAERPDDVEVRADLAALLAQTERHDEAEPHLRAALRERPDDPHLRTYLAVGETARGRLDAALALLRDVVAEHPDHAMAHQWLGNVRQRQGDLDAAERHYRDAIAAGLELPDAWVNLGAVHAQRGDLEAAVRSTRRALELAPDHALAHNNLGVFLERSDPEASLAHARRAVELEPASAAWANRLGARLFVAGDAAGAVALLERALALAPDDRDLLNNLGWILATRPEPELGDGARAVEAAERAVALSDGTRSLDVLAAARLRAGDTSGAAEAAARALAVEDDSPHPSTLAIRALALARLGRADEARAAWARVPPRDRWPAGDPGATALLEEAAAELGAPGG